jgi:choline dehydrogenase-like flavoprotein
VFDTIGESLEQVPKSGERVGRYLLTKGDPNDGRYDDGDEGVRYTPLSTRKKARGGTRERLLEVAAAHPENLRIETDALATRVLLDESKRAIGVEYLKGKRLYQAHHDPSADPGEARKALASREVILAGGAFNSPQLLMLSGIGPPEQLKKHGIDVAVPLPGVGSNLQDRYEMGVVNRMQKPWKVLEGANFSTADPLYEEWKRSKKGTYTSNGAAIAVVKRSFPARRLPDLFCFALLGDFRGYYPGYSKALAKKLNALTWAILKAHTNNTAGEVSLQSKNPRERPFINFRYFPESNDHNHEDIDSIVEGIKFVRKLTAPLKKQKIVEEEEFPGEQVRSDDDLRALVYDHAWGHHASCTCRIGPDGDEMAVLDSKLRVRGARNLRVVDASVFPRIPGFFIASSIFMVGEKAADLILDDAAS